MMTGKIYVIGMGPGKKEYMTLEAVQALTDSDVIVGYTVYADMLRDEYKDKEILATGMCLETERCDICIERAGKGQTAALISSGDAGVYGMASLLLERLGEQDDIEVKIVAGVTAALSGAARLGAPIGHDFCVISLSDLLTPWELIERRLVAAARGDFAIVIYNPSSRNRPEHLKRGYEILSPYINADRPCGLVRNIGRDDEEAKVFAFSELPTVETDMFTTVFIGNPTSVVIDGRLVTPRGYNSSPPLRTWREICGAHSAGDFITDGECTPFVMNDKRKSVIVFSGTSEGRQLSERLEAAGIDHCVCVASGFGEVMQPEGEHILIHSGRMDAEEMRGFIEDDTRFVVDATHPYATEVSENIKAALSGRDIGYLRIVRDEGQSDDSVSDMECIEYFSDAMSCAEALSHISGNILFTTGSRELSVLCEKIADKKRLYARVLPAAESIAECRKNGIQPDHIIAMTGPFSVRMNEAVISEYDIACMVTKDGGKNGGFGEKAAAARAAGIRLLCIRRPHREEGYDVDGAYEYIVKRQTEGEKPRAARVPDEASVTISVIGAGPGDTRDLTARARACIKETDLLFGAGRLIEPFSEKEAYSYFRSADIAAKLSEKLSGGAKEVNAAVIFSGDVSFYSGAEDFTRGIREWAKRNRLAIRIEWFPGISSVSALGAALKVPYQDAGIYSLHGRNDEWNIRRVASKISRDKAAFVLLSDSTDAVSLEKELVRLGVKGHISMASRLSYPDESVERYEIGVGDRKEAEAPVIAYIKNDGYPFPHGLIIPYMEDEEFARNKTPMTKAVIRHESIRELKLKHGDVLYDVGSGTGSVSVEAAALSEDITVYSFEMKDEAVAVETENIERFALSNVTVIKGEAPDNFGDTEEPDAVFIGGSSGRLKEILERLKKYQRRIRVVITAVSVETRAEISGLFLDEAVSDLRVREISVSTAREAGKHRLMRAEDSVMIASFDLIQKGEKCE